jgi:hypothetical protein
LHDGENSLSFVEAQISGLAGARNGTWASFPQVDIQGTGIDEYSMAWR